MSDNTTGEEMRDFTRALFGSNRDQPASTTDEPVEPVLRNVVPREGATPTSSGDQDMRDFANDLFNTNR